jgi:Dyp-type peroxidase family
MLLETSTRLKIPLNNPCLFQTIYQDLFFQNIYSYNLKTKLQMKKVKTKEALIALSNPLLAKQTLDPIDFDTWNNTLSNLQGNILKGHGRDHTTHIFLRFKNNRKSEAINWLKNFEPTSFKKQLKEREAFARNKTNGNLFCNIFFTPSGLAYFTDTNNSSINDLNDDAFANGMLNRKDILGDTEALLEEEYKHPWHMMILLADDNETRMSEFVKPLLAEITDEDNLWKNSILAKDNDSLALHIEYGHALRNANGDGLEHNGYVDGTSQPLFLKDEQDSYKKMHGISDWFIKDQNNNDIPNPQVKFNPLPQNGLAQVLFPDPLVDQNINPDSFGSYFVFRKLEQDVRGFKIAEKKLGLGERGGATIVGRYEDGTPITVSEDDGMIASAAFNNFNYDEDKVGGKCPYFAHVRKVNPRENDDQKARIMARRGIPFGRRDVDTSIDPSMEQMPTRDVGLLFMSFQSSIINQFEFIQQSWANNPNFNFSSPIQPVGIDPVIGQGIVGKYDFPKDWNDNMTQPLSKEFGTFTTMRGGEYFYAASIPFIKNL